MKLYFLGTCAGTKPIAGWHHQSFAIEAGQSVYLFDAGECSAYTAHLMGMNLLQVKSVFISHTHFDHVGGLANLFWNIKKLKGRFTNQESCYKINLFIPDRNAWMGVKTLLEADRGNFLEYISVEPFDVQDGIIFSDDNLLVEAIHTEHMGKTENSEWKSFAYKIICEGKTIIYTGDIGLGNMEDLDRIVCDCDMLLVETGHHSYTEVLDALKGKNIEMIAFIHNGEDIRKNPLQACYQAQLNYDWNVIICTDATTLTI